MVVYDSSDPVCTSPPCLRVGGMGPQSRRQRTYHACCSAPLLLVVRPFAEPHSGIDQYDLGVSVVATREVLWASALPPLVPHGPVCETNGNCPTGATHEHLVVPVRGPQPEDGPLTATATAVNGAGLNSTETADFVLDATHPVAVPPQALLFQPQTAFVSLEALWGAYEDPECTEGAERGIQHLSWALHEGAQPPGTLPQCSWQPSRTPTATGHADPGGCNSAIAERVCVRVQWGTCNGLWGPLSSVNCQPWAAQAPSCGHAPRFTVAAPTAGAAYRMWRVHPELPRVGCLRYEGNATYEFTETVEAYYTACPQPEHLGGREFTGATFADYTNATDPWRHVDWVGALGTPSAIPPRVATDNAASVQVHWLSVYVSNFAGLTSGDTYRVVLDSTPPLAAGVPRAVVLNYTTIELSWEGVFDDPESGMDWFEWELEHAQRLHAMYWTNTTGSPVPGLVRPTGATNVTLALPFQTFTSNTPLRLRVHGVNRAGLRSTSNDTLFWVDFSPPELVPGSEIAVGHAGVECWDRLTGPFTARWDSHFHDPHTWLERFFLAIGTPTDPEKYVPKKDVESALTWTQSLTFDEGDDVVVTVWGQNPMGLHTRSTSRVLRIDASAVRSAWPLPVRDLHPDALLVDADIDFQSERARLSASWSGWWSEHGWILEYRVVLTAWNGTQAFLVCPGVSVGLSTNVTSDDLPGCAHGGLEHGLMYFWTVTAVGCNAWTTEKHSDGVTIDATPPDLTAVTVADGPRHGRHEMDWQSHQLPVLSARWDGDVREDVSPIERLEWALGTAPGGSDVMDWTPAAATCVPLANWCEHCPAHIARARQCSRGGGPEVCIRLQYKLCGGDWGGLSPTYCEAWGAGCTAPIQFPLSGHLASPALLGYRLYRVDPADEDRGCLKAEGVGPGLDSWTETDPALATSCTALATIVTPAFHPTACPAGLRTPPRAWCNGTAPEANATHHHPVCARLQWGMCGQWGGLSTVCCQDWAVPGHPGPAFALSHLALPADVEGYRVYRVDPADPESGCLRAYGGARWPWAWSGAMWDWQEGVRDFGAACPAAHQIAIGLPDTMAYQPPNLTLGTTYYATLRVTNAAGLAAIVSSDGVTWVETPLDAGDVHDGPLPLQDTDWQSDNRSLSASWVAFYSFFGPRHYEVCAGTQPGLCDVAALENITNHSTPAVVPHPMHLQVYSHTMHDLELLEGRTYYVTVTLVDTIGRRTAATSNGVSIDTTPPLPGAVFDGRLRDFSDIDHTWSSKIFGWWDAFSDPESGLRYQAAATTDPDGRTVEDWTDVPPGSVVSVLATAVPDGTVLYHHVRARNGAGLSCIASSDGVLVDSRPPPRGDVGDGLDDDLALYQNAPYNGTAWDMDFQRGVDALSGRWRGFVALARPLNASAVPPRFRYAPPRLEVGVSTTRAPPPSGLPDVVPWVACDPGDAPVLRAACAEVAAGALEALLLSCWNETMSLERLPWERAAWDANCTCLGALKTYRSSCIYQGLEATDPTKLLVDRLHAACAPRPPPCAPWPAHAGNFTAANLTLTEEGTYYVLVRATAQSGLGVVVASDGLTVDRSPPEPGWLRTASYTRADGAFDVFAFWGGWADRGRLNHYEVCIERGDRACRRYTDARLTTAHHFRLPPAYSIAHWQVCVQAWDSVRLHAGKCVQVIQMSLEPPTPGWVQNRWDAHRDFVAELTGCHWGGWGAPPGTGGIKYYQWGIGLRPNGTEILPFQYSPYIRQGAVPPLPLPLGDPEQPVYCTVRAITAAGVGATASSDPFRVCPAVARAAVTVPATQNVTDELCATWVVAPGDPGAGCVARQAWAIGHRPFGTSVRDFTEVSGAGACARVSLADGEEYFVTLQLHGKGGAVAAFASAGVHADHTPPHIRALELRASVAGHEAAQGAAYGPAAGTGNLTATWDVREPHSAPLRIVLEVWADDEVVATRALDTAPTGHTTFALRLAANRTYQCRAHVRNRAMLWASRASNAVLIDGTPPAPLGLVRDGRDPRVDWAWQRSGRHLAASWAPFSDPESRVQRQEVCFGTAPGALCDVAPFAIPTDAYLHVHEVVGPQPLRDNVTYFATVRVYNGAGLHTDVSSDGVTVDAEAPVFPRGAGVALAGGGTATSSHAVSVEWDAAEDGASGVAGYELNVGHQPYGASMHQAIAAGTSLNASLQLVPGPPEYPFYVTVRATDGAGRATRICSRRFILDTSPPAMGQILFALVATKTGAKRKPPPLPPRGFWVFLEDAVDEQTGIAGVSWWLRGRASDAPASASGTATDWRRGWRVRDLPVPTGPYYFGVEVRNGLGLRTRRETPLVLDGTGPTGGAVWDGPGGVDLEAIRLGTTVVTSWEGIWDPESPVHLLEYSLQEETPNRTRRDVVPWREVSGHQARVQAALAVGARYVSKLRATNSLGQSTEFETNGFTVMPPGGGDWAPGLVAPPYTPGPVWALEWARVRAADPRPDPSSWVAVGMVLGTDTVLAWTDAGHRAEWVYNGTASALADGGAYWATVVTEGGVRSAARTVLDGSPPVAHPGQGVAVVAPQHSREFFMNGTVELCWRGTFSDPHSGVEVYNVTLEHGGGVVASYPGQEAECITIVHRLASGAALTVAVTALNRAGLSTTVTGSFTVDLTPPAPPTALAYGTRAHPHVAQASRTSFSAEWTPFVDPESGPAATSVCLGTAPGACDIAEQAVAGASRLALRALPPFNASAVWPLLTACNRASLCTSWRPAVPLWIDLEPPEVNVTVAGPTRCPIGPSYPCETVWLDDARRITAGLSLRDRGSALRRCVWGVGASAGADNVRGFAAVPGAAGQRRYAGEVTAAVALPEGVPLYVTVRCQDAAALVTARSVPVAALSAGPGTAEAVLRVSPAAAPSPLAGTRVAWTGFDALDPDLVEYLVAVGPRPERDDFLRWTAAGNRTSHVLDGLALPEGPAWVSVTARYPSLRASTVSHRLLVDSSPPTPGVVQRLAAPPLTPQCLANMSALELQWMGFEDSGSAIASYEFAVAAAGAAAGPTWKSTGRRSFASVPATAWAPGAYRVLVRATDAAGNRAESALDLVVDDTAPEMPDVAVFGAVPSPTVASLSDIRVEWAPANDTECGVVDYSVAVGQGPDSTTVLGYTSVGLATEVRLGNLTMRQGQRYTLTLLALNGAGLSSRAYAEFLVDATAPLPGDVYLQSGPSCQAPAGPARVFVASPDNVTLCARGFRDPESDTAWAVALFLSGAPVLPWHAVAAAAALPGGPGHTVGVREFNATLLAGVPYTARLRVTNAAGLGQVAESAPFYLDASPPAVLWFLHGTRAAQAPCALVGDELRAEWAFADPESGPEACWWGVGSRFGAQDVMPYTPIAHEEGYVSEARAGLPAAPGHFYVSLLMTNRAGLRAEHHVAVPLVVLEACAEGEPCASSVKCL